LSLLVAISWRTLKSRLSATALFSLRVLPLFFAAGVVLLVAVPSFFYLEPNASDESVGTAGILLALGGTAVTVMGLVSVVATWRRASRFLASCAAHSRQLKTDVGVPAFEVSGPAPALLVGGVCRPRLLVSGRAAELLNQREMDVAIRHELAHIRRRDNLKKLVLHFCLFPFLAALDREWLMAAEIAADDFAVNDEQAALDLASALLKIARDSSSAPMPALAMSLVPERGAAISARVERLLSWKRPANQRRSWRALAVVAAVAVLAVTHYPWVLAQMHEFTELLVR
jgi:beta-lactamase regulating signal transducer with metallopeptidase domain